MKQLIIVSITVLLVTISINAFGHEHSKNTAEDTVSQVASSIHGDSVMLHEMEKHHEMKSVDAFPNYHPLVVHFPIVLIIMAFVFQLLSFFVYKKEFSLATLILLALGVISAGLASNTFHAHPLELTGRAKEIFETHEQMASFTWWFSLIALLIKISSHFFMKRKWWMESIATLFLLASAITVSIAGHHGAMLVHIEGIGPKGEHLELHDHDE
ncbi:MAG: DUF2231 domain-containing protein [Bacteroidia bacterium]